MVEQKNPRKLQPVHDLMDRVEAYAAVTGRTADNVVRSATGDPRCGQTLMPRTTKLERDIEKIEAYLRDHPPKTKDQHNGKSETSSTGEA